MLTVCPKFPQIVLFDHFFAACKQLLHEIIFDVDNPSHEFFLKVQPVLYPFSHWLSHPNKQSEWSL